MTVSQGQTCHPGPEVAAATGQASVSHPQTLPRTAQALLRRPQQMLRSRHGSFWVTKGRLSAGLSLPNRDCNLQASVFTEDTVSRGTKEPGTRDGSSPFYPPDNRVPTAAGDGRGEAHPPRGAQALLGAPSAPRITSSHRRQGSGPRTPPGHSKTLQREEGPGEAGGRSSAGHLWPGVFRQPRLRAQSGAHRPNLASQWSCVWGAAWLKGSGPRALVRGRWLPLL